MKVHFGGEVGFVWVFPVEALQRGLAKSPPRPVSVAACLFELSPRGGPRGGLSHCGDLPREAVPSRHLPAGVRGPCGTGTGDGKACSVLPNVEGPMLASLHVET